MKKTFYQLLLLLLLPALSMAQSNVSSKDILAKINAGQAVTYTNVRISGDLDLTQLTNKTLVKNRLNDMGSKIYLSTVTAPLTFINCVFTGDVLAYYNPDNDKFQLFNQSDEEVFNTNFEKDVTFSGCTFEKASVFKYSEFKGKVSFAGSRFKDEALFKYAEFSSAPNFSKAAFEDVANFKYVKFPAATSFQAASFRDDADFKYAEFESNADFKSSVFNRLANFKYSKFIAPEFKGAQFKGDEDFKYTMVNGRKMSASTILTGISR